MLQRGRAIRSGFDFGDSTAVSRFGRKNDALYRLSGIGVVFMDGQGRTAVILQNNGTGLPREELHMMLGRIQQMIPQCGRLTDGVNARLQVGDQDLSLFIGRAIQVVGAILNFGDTEGDASQSGAVRTQFDEV